MDFAHVLVATDFSECAEQALVDAIALARRGGKRITLLHVFQPPPYSTPGLGMYVASPEELQQLTSEAVRDLQKLRARYEDSGIDIEVRLRIDHRPAEEIVSFADAHGCDLIVVGSHGRRGLRRLTLGSVADKVVRTAKVPVLTVHAPAPAETSPGSP